ncbi:helix-hairpin-helix domain-containing protein [Fictibacillus iocasae]|uniref:Helix-hairpin-helix domain-containing protein n=1 Tax=Fictibacillus iocasae TaxID=2715437 RepID=A0ABW2NRL8_9BACL
MGSEKIDLPKVGKPAQRALTQAGCNSLEDITKHSETEIASLHGVGPKAMKQLQQALQDNGMNFADNKTKG